MSAPSPREVELKLMLDPADLPRLRALLEAELGAPETTAQLRSVYYDTPSHDLADAGVSLRLRVDGERFIQTVKRAQHGAAALFSRDEWETSLTSCDIDPVAFARTPAGSGLVDAAARLAPIFETVLERTTWQAPHDGSLVEVALDEGRVVAGPRSEPLVELEFELKRGEARDLFRVLRRFGDIGSLHPGTETKSARGYRLVRDKPRRASKAEPIRLDRHMTAATAAQTILRGCLAHFCRNVPLVIGARSPEALHQARVALRRLRSTLSLFKWLLADQHHESFRRGFQAVSHRLGEARNLDVFLAQHAPDKGDDPALDPAVLAAMERRRNAAYDEIVEDLRAPALYTLLLRLVEWIEAGPWLVDRHSKSVAARETPVRRTAAKILSQRRRRLKRGGRHLAALDPHLRHRVRIEAKKLRYASEFFAGLVERPKEARRHAALKAALEDLQQHLGDLNDMQTAADLMRSFAAHRSIVVDNPAVDTPAPVDEAGQTSRTESLLEAAEEAHGRLVAVKRYWSSWRD